MIALDVPPKLILPDHYQANRPAIIRPVGDLARYFPVELDRKQRRAIVAELVKLGAVDDRAKASKLIEAAVPFGSFAPGVHLSFVASNNGNSATAVIPASSSVGDLALVFYAARNTTATSPAYVDLEATGWTIVFSGAGTSAQARIACFAKVLASGEPGSNVVGPSGTDYSRYVAAAFRCSRKINGITTNEREQFATTAPPASYVKNVDSVPLGNLTMVIASWIAQASFTPTETPSMTALTTSSATLFLAKYTIYNPGVTKVDQTTGMPDTGVTNVHGSAYLTFTF